MYEKKQPDDQSSSCSYTMLQLKAHKIQLIVDNLGIISNEIQALGSVLESLGSAITVHGNLIGKAGFELETIATRLHIASIMYELHGEEDESKANLLLQLRAYDILLTANRLGVMSNDLQAYGAYLQAIGAASVAYGNWIAIKEYELGTIVTKLQIVSVLQEIKEQNSQSKAYEAPQNDHSNIIPHSDNNQQVQYKELYIQVQQLQNTIYEQQAQIQQIQKTLKEIKGSA